MALLVCKMAIFAQLHVGLLPFSYFCHTYFKMFEENKAMKATKGGFGFLSFLMLFAL